MSGEGNWQPVDPRYAALGKRLAAIAARLGCDEDAMQVLALVPLLDAASCGAVYLRARQHEDEVLWGARARRGSAADVAGRLERAIGIAPGPAATPAPDPVHGAPPGG